MSSELVWDIVRRESSFVRKFGNVELSAEPLNVVGKNSYKHSGLSQSKAVGVAVVSVKGKGDKVRLLKKAGASNKPNKATVVTYLTHGRPRAGKAVNAVRFPHRPCVLCVFSRVPPPVLTGHC
jgi:Ribosomal L28e protein family